MVRFRCEKKEYQSLDAWLGEAREEAVRTRDFPAL